MRASCKNTSVREAVCMMRRQLFVLDIYQLLRMDVGWDLGKIGQNMSSRCKHKRQLDPRFSRSLFSLVPCCITASMFSC